ncbi:MAG: uridine kinase [Acidobacteriia bacterium]|nr:uridine kinase [Terriglobia bacterium]
MAARAYLIGVAGPSCAGKTELSTNLAAQLPAAILPLDCYYVDLSDRLLEERIKFNFDEPGALDHDLFLRHVRALSNGREIERPVYDFATHTRTRNVELVKPRKFIVVEGLFVLYWQDVRSLFGTRVFVDLPDKLCLDRRIVRDVRERGRTPESVRRQFAETVQPMAELHVRPTKAFADLVIAGDNPIQQSVDAVMAHVRRTT